MSVLTPCYASFSCFNSSSLPIKNYNDKRWYHLERFLLAIPMESSRNSTFTERFWLKCSSMKYQAWTMHPRITTPTQNWISFRMYKMYCMYSASLSKFLSTCTYGNWNAMTSDLFRIDRPESRDRETEFWHVWQFNLWLWTLIFPISSFRKDHPADLG